MTPKTHCLKTWPPYFQEILDGNKTFDLRANDRDFHSGDILLLQEYDPKHNVYTGREVSKKIGFMLDGQWGLVKGVCCLSLLPMETERVDDSAEYVNV